MTAKDYIQWRINTGDRFLVNLHKDDRDLLASILEQYAALRQPPVVGQSEQFICDAENNQQVKCKEQCFWCKTNNKHKTSK